MSKKLETNIGLGKGTQHDPQRMTVASFNTLGVPYTRPGALKRYAKICETLERSDIDILSLQEVFTKREFRFLRQGLKSFPYLSYKPSPSGPKGALVTFSRAPIETDSFTSFYKATKSVDRSALPAFTLAKSVLKGVLISRIPENATTILNVHLTANKDNDWSHSDRFYPLHKAQLDALSGIIKTRLATSDDTLIVNGDFNIAQDSELYEQFAASSGLTDIFEDDLIPTFHSEFLDEGQEPHCIDHMLISGIGKGTQVAETSYLFEDKMRLADEQRQYVSDHIGLQAILLTSSGTASAPLA